MKNLNLSLLLLGVILSLTTAQIPKMSPNCTVLKQPDLYLENEWYVGNAQEYISGFNITYSIKSQNNSLKVSVTNPSTPLSTAANSLNKILSSDSWLDRRTNYVYYGLLEFEEGYGYRIFFKKSTNATQAPNFDQTPQFTVRIDQNIVLLSTTVLNDQWVMVSGYNNGTTPKKNVFYFVGFSDNKMVEYDDWDPNWKDIKARKIVKFNYYPAEGVTGTYLAMITGNLDIVFNNFNTVTNGIYIYRFDPDQTSLSLEHKIVSTDYQNNAPDFVIFDIAASSEQLFLLDQTNIFRFQFDPVAKMPKNWFAYPLWQNSQRMAVYEDGKSTSLILIHDLSLNELVVETDNNRVLKNATYETNFPLGNVKSVYITSNYMAISLPHYVVVYQRRGGRGLGQIFGMYGYENMNEDYTFRLLANDYALTIGPRITQLFHLTPPIILGRTQDVDDLWTLTATSTALNLTQTCISYITVQNIGTNISNWGVYTTNVTQTNDFGNRGIILTENKRFAFDLGRSFVGWNISYEIQPTSFLNENLNEISIIQPFQTEFVFMAPDTPNPKQTIYQRSYATGPNTFAHIVQGQDKILYFQSCSVKGEIYNCTLNGQLQLGNDVRDISMNNIVGGTIWIVAILEFESLTVNFVQFNDISQSFIIDQALGLESLQIIGNFAFLVSSQLKYIKIYELTDVSATLVSTIDETIVKYWPLDISKWKPLRVHSSPIYPNRIVIESVTGFYLIGISMNDLAIYYFSSMNLGGDTSDEQYSRSIQFFGDFLVVIEGTFDNLKVNEYSLMNPYSPLKTHEVKCDKDLVPIFPIVATYSTNSRLFYNLMNNQKTGEIYLYAIRFGQTSVNSVYKLFKLDSSQTSSQNYRISAASLGPIDWVLVTDQAQNSTVGFSVNDISMVQLRTVGRNDNAEPNSQNYLDIYSYDIWARGGYTYNERRAATTFGVINSQILIAPVAGLNATEVQFDGQNGSSFELNPGRYFAGTVFQYSLNNSNFTIKPKLSLSHEYQLATNQSSVDFYQNLQDIQTFPGDTSNNIYMLMRNGTLVQVNEQGTEQSIGGLDPSNLYTCYQLYVKILFSNQYAYTMCFDKNDKYNFVLYNITDGSLVHAFTLDDVQQYTSVDLLTENSVVIVDSLLDSTYSGRAYLYNLLDKNAILINTIKSGTCGLPNNFNVVFSRSTVYDNRAALWLLDGFGNGLAAISIDLTTYACSSQSVVINLADKLYNQNGFIPTNALYQRFRIIKSQTTGLNSTHTVLLQLVDVPVFQFTVRLAFDEQNNQIAYFFLDYLTAIYNNYQPYNALIDSFSLSSDAQNFAITYLKSSSNQQATYMIAVYDLVNTSPSFVPAVKGLVPLNTISAVYTTDPTIKQGFPTMSFGCSPGVLYVWKDVNSTIQTLNYSPNITITSLEQVQEKIHLEISGSSDFSTASYVQSVGISGQDDDGDSSLLWLWITIGVVGGIAIGAALYFFFRKRNLLELQHQLTDEQTNV